MRRIATGLTGLAALLAAGTVLAGVARIEGLQLSAGGSDTSLAVTLSEPARYRLFTLDGPPRLVLDISGAKLSPRALPLPAGSGAIRQVRVGNRPDGSVRVVLDLVERAEPQTALRRSSGAGTSEIIVSLPGAVPAQQAATSPLPAPPAASLLSVSPVSAPATAVHEPSQRAAVAMPAAAASAPPPQADAPPRGRDIVVAIDAGHGGNDPGAHGPRGLLEKDVTLRIARRLAEVVDEEPGMRAVLTRNRDEFLPLRSRMERARAARADLFVSVHADAVRNRTVRGASVYVLNEKGATDEAARRLAARENAADLIGGVTLKGRDRTLASVLLDLSQNASLSSSIEVGDAVLAELARVATVRKPRVMQAPFMVLKSPDVPSVLVETAYISNPEEERRLGSHEFRDRLAKAIFSGVRVYFYRNPPRGTLVAELSRRQLAAAAPQSPAVMAPDGVGAAGP